MFALLSNRPVTQAATAQRNSAAALAMGVLLLAGPVNAANTVQSHCSEAGQANLHIQVSALVPTRVSYTATDATSTDSISADSADSHLAPRAAAAIRDAFNDKEPKKAVNADVIKAAFVEPAAGAEMKAVTKPDEEQTDVADQTMHTKLPGVSDDDLSRYKKQMYRRDI